MSQSTINKFISVAVITFITVLQACEQNPLNEEAKKIQAAVTILPLADLVKRIGGSEVSVATMLPPGANPHSYEPTPRQLTKLSSASLYFKIGGVFQFEDIWIDKIKPLNDSLMIIDCSRDIKIKNNNPHIWLGILELKIIAQNIYNGLSENYPAQKNYFYSNVQKIIREIDSIDTIIRESLSELKDKEIIVYHPSWEYFLSRYEIQEISIEKEGKEPNAGDLKELIQFAKECNIKAVFIELQFDPSSAKAVADEIGAELVYIDPLPADVMINFIDVTNKLKKYLN